MALMFKKKKAVKVGSLSDTQPNGRREVTPEPPPLIKTRILILADTLARDFANDFLPTPKADVALFCGGLTYESTYGEFQESLKFLTAIDAPLKLVIPGSRDFTFDEDITPLFWGDEEESSRADTILASRRMFRPDQLAGTGIVYLSGEGTYRTRLANGAFLTLYFSPFTPFRGPPHAAPALTPRDTTYALAWPPGFRYRRSSLSHPSSLGSAPIVTPSSNPSDSITGDPGLRPMSHLLQRLEGGHRFLIEDGTDIVMTYGPPYRVLDWSSEGEFEGCPDLRRAVVLAKPKIHCFGSTFLEWGATIATWGSEKPAWQPIEGRLGGGNQGAAGESSQSAPNLGPHVATSHCSGDEHPVRSGEHTLFVNATTSSPSPDPLVNGTYVPPWLVDIELPRREPAGWSEEP